MKKMYFVYAVTTGVLLCNAGMAAAQTPGTTERFGESLGALKDSARQLSLANGTLAARNDELAGRLKQLQTSLQQSAEENNALTKASLKLQDNNPSRAKKITQLEKEIFDINSQMDKAAEGIKTAKEGAERGRAEDERLATRMKDLHIDAALAPSVQAPAAPAVNYAKEKLRLLKMAAESKQRQENLYHKIADAQSIVSPPVTVETPNRRDGLFSQLTRLQEDVDQLQKMSQAPPPPSVDPKQLSQLEAQVKQLQKNQDELEVLVARMQQKLPKTAVSPDQRNEQNTFKSTLDNLNREGKKLKVALADLRQQMVTLDKRKTALDAQLRN